MTRTSIERATLPRWVRLRRALFLASAVVGVGFAIAALTKTNGLALLLLILLWGILSVAVPLPHLPALMRLMARPAPGLAAWSETFLERWEFDPDARTGKTSRS